MRSASARLNLEVLCAEFYLRDAALRKKRAVIAGRAVIGKKDNAFCECGASDADLRNLLAWHPLEGRDTEIGGMHSREGGALFEPGLGG